MNQFADHHLQIVTQQQGPCQKKTNLISMETYSKNTAY